MKKKLVLSLSLLFPLFTAPTLTSCGGGGIPGDIDYDNANWEATSPEDFVFDYFEGEGYYVADYRGKDKEIRIPITVNVDGREDKVVGLEGCCFALRENVETVYLPNSIRKIGANAFTQSSIKNVYPGLGLVDVDEHAFENSQVKTSVKDGITYLPSPSTEHYYAIAFDNQSESVSFPEGCIGYIDYMLDEFVGKVNFPSTLQIIGASNNVDRFEVTVPGSSLNLYRALTTWVLFSCENLKTITLTGDGTEYGTGILSSATEKLVLSKNTKHFVPYWANSNYALKSIEVNQDNPAFKSEDGILYSKDGKTLCYYPSHKDSNSTFQIPSAVTTIDYMAFYDCWGIKNLVIPEGVEAIKDGAFNSSHSLKIANIPASLKEIGKDALRDANITSLSEGGVKYCGNDTNPHQAVVGYEGGYITSLHNDAKLISGGAFRGCDKLNNLTIPDGLTYIGEGAFANSSLTSLTLGNGINEIPEEAFENCASLATLTLNGACSKFATSSVSGCSRLTNIEIPETNNYFVFSKGLYSKDKSAYVRCLPSSEGFVNVLESVTFILPGAFSTCVNVTSIDITATSVTSLPDGLFSGLKGLTWCNLSDTITKFGDYLFNGCSSLQTVTIPADLAYLPYNTFNECTSLSNFQVSSTSQRYAFYDGGLYSKDYKNLIRASLAPRSQSLTINSDCESIDSYAFYQTKVNKLSVPSNVKTIAPYAFYQSKVTAVTTSAESIGRLAFYLSRDMTSLTLNLTKQIGPYAFQYCHGLTNVVLPDGLKEIETGVFYRCSKLSSITIPASVKKIGDDAFYWDDALKTAKYLGKSWDEVSIGSGNEYLKSAMR